MKPYNFQGLGHPPKLMKQGVIGERVAVIDVNRATRTW